MANVLLQAWEDSTPFSVIVVDARPVLESTSNNDLMLLSTLKPSAEESDWSWLLVVQAYLMPIITFPRSWKSRANGAVCQRVATALSL